MAATASAPASTSPDGRTSWLAEAERIDLAVYRAVATTRTPRLDQAMRRLSHAADYSRLSIASGVLLAVAGGRRGQRAAATGLASVAATSAFVNLVVKPFGRRPRPDRTTQSVPVARHCAFDVSLMFVAVEGSEKPKPPMTRSSGTAPVV